MKLESAACPRCGAPVRILDGREYVTCGYCGTSSFLVRDKTTSPPPGAPTIYVTPPGAASASAIALLAALVLLLVGVAVALVLLRGSRAAPGLGSDASRQFADRPLLADVDGDGVQDVLGVSRRFVPSEQYWLGAQSGKDGKELWRISSLPKQALDHEGIRILAGASLVVADGLGKVRAFDLRSGKPTWERSVPEKPFDACVAGDAVVIQTLDRALAAFAIASGDARPAPAKNACRPTYVSRHDDAPGYRVVSWSEFDALGLPFINSIPGMLAHRALVPEGPGPRFMLGSRAGGSTVGMVAAVTGAKQVLWKSDVPGVEPLSTFANVLTQTAALGQGKLVIPYQLGAGGTDGVRLTCFEAATGKRLWDTQIPRVKNSVSFGLSISQDGQVFYATWTSLHVLSLDTGEPRWSIGSPM